MQDKHVLCFFHPTTVFIVDDNQVFLDNITDNLSKDVFYKLYSSPISLLQDLENHKQQELVPEYFLGSYDDPVTGQLLNVDIPKIQQRLHDESRYASPSVVIVDNDMPEMSGLDFCQAIRGSRLKKIMLTGTADYKVAVRAFNEGIIDKFILKDDPDVFAAIDRAVIELQQQYFSEYSAVIVKNLTSKDNSYLNNTAFFHFFNQLIKDLNIVEFYLLHSRGSFILMNNNKVKMRLVVQTANDMQNFCEIAEDNDAAPVILNALKNKDKMLCLFSEDDFNRPVHEWESFLFDATPIPGIENSYYALI